MYPVCKLGALDICEVISIACNRKSQQRLHVMLDSYQKSMHHSYRDIHTENALLGYTLVHTLMTKVKR